MKEIQDLVDNYNYNDGFGVIEIHEDIKLLDPNYDLNDYDASGYIQRDDGGRYIELWTATSGLDEYKFLEYLISKGYKQFNSLEDQGNLLKSDRIPSIRFKSDEDAYEFINIVDNLRLVKIHDLHLYDTYSNIVVKPDDYKKFKEDINEFLEKENFKILIFGKLYSKI